ncbi:MAG TPA: hypothetical protein VGQ36_15000 [Thermoanaerobaculia bacterium]|jgi:hypothetical protein|nr:hypothetical protein [Thermoanaerobaculia bacterium]
MRNELDHTPPLLTLDKGKLHYDNDWSLPLDAVRVIGEYTTEAGPAEEDYFIVFIDGAGASYGVPVTALTPVATEQLREYFGPLKFGLHWSTDLRSRIMWPEYLADEAVYDFTPVPPRTIGDRLRRLFGTQNLDVRLSTAASGALKERLEHSYGGRGGAMIAASQYSLPASAQQSVIVRTRPR